MRAITALFPVDGTPRAENDFSGFFQQVVGQLQEAGIVSIGCSFDIDESAEFPLPIAAVTRAGPGVRRACISLESECLAPGAQVLVFTTTKDDDDQATGGALAAPQLHIVVFDAQVEFRTSEGTFSSWALIAFSYDDRDLRPEQYGIRVSPDALFKKLRVVSPQWSSAVLPIAS